MDKQRRDFILTVGASAGSLALGACGGGSSDPAAASTATGSGSTSKPGSLATPPATVTLSPQMVALKAFLQNQASPTFGLPSLSTDLPGISWAGALVGGGSPATTLPNGLIIPITNASIGGPDRQLYVANLPGNPMVGGYPCQGIGRTYVAKGVTRSASSPTVLRFKTDAPTFEIAGVVADGGFTVQTMIVDGYLVPAKALSSSRGVGGWNVGSVKVSFSTRKVRDIWIETGVNVAYVKVGQYDSFFPVGDTSEPQITFVGDSYLQKRSAVFGNGGAIALEAGARLGVRKVAVDAIGGTGYWNSGNSLGNLNDRLAGTVQDNSAIYFVMAGLNDYGDSVSPSSLVWPTTAVYDQAVLGYLQGLRAAQPNALIVVTAPFCPNPCLSDASYVANPATNTSGLGDFPFKAQQQKNAISQIAGPWVYIDVLMGGGWINSSGASGDITNLQWFTGGTPVPGTTATYKPGNTHGGGGGAYGGIASVPVLSGGVYTQAPEITATGGSGSGLLLTANLNASGAISSINVVVAGNGYTAGTGLPALIIDPTYQVSAASLGTPALLTPVNPNGQYPLPSFAPAGYAGSLDNIAEMIDVDTVHPSPVGVQYLSTRLAQNLYQAVMAL